MAAEIILPKMGLTMEEGVITKWRKAEGETVAVGDVLFELETDKTSLTVESEAAGILLKILLPEGETAPIATRVAIIGESGEDITSLLPVAPQTDPAGAPPSQAVAPSAPTRSAEATPEVAASPRARKVAKENGVDLSLVTGTGSGGRIGEDDVRAYIESGAGKARPPALPSGGQTIAYTGVRRKIGERMLESYSRKPHIFQTLDVDMSVVVRDRARLKAQGGFAPSIADYVVRATAEALKKHPVMNAALSGDEITMFSEIHIGYAVDVAQGLVVPVVRDCGAKSIAEIAKERRVLVQKALDGKLGVDDSAGGTFTITSLAALGIQSFTAIINPPQTAILAVAACADRVVAVDGMIAVRPMMTLTIGCDHRAADGAESARTLVDIKNLLESGEL